VANRKILERIINRKDVRIRAGKLGSRKESDGQVLVTAARFLVT
jgi:hypothetical protein